MERLDQLRGQLDAPLEERLSIILNGADQRWRNRVFDVLKEPIFEWTAALGKGMAEERRITRERLKRLMDPKLGFFFQYGSKPCV